MTPISTLFSCLSLSDEIQSDLMLFLPFPVFFSSIFNLLIRYYLWRAKEVASRARGEQRVWSNWFHLQPAAYCAKIRWFILGMSHLVIFFSRVTLLFVPLRCLSMYFEYRNLDGFALFVSSIPLVVLSSARQGEGRTHKSCSYTKCSPRSISENFIYSLFVLGLRYCGEALWGEVICHSPHLVSPKPLLQGACSYISAQFSIRMHPLLSVADHPKLNLA